MRGVGDPEHIQVFHAKEDKILSSLFSLTGQARHRIFLIKDKNLWDTR